MVHRWGERHTLAPPVSSQYAQSYSQYHPPPTPGGGQLGALGLVAGHSHFDIRSVEVILVSSPPPQRSPSCRGVAGMGGGWSVTHNALHASLTNNHSVPVHRDGLCWSRRTRGGEPDVRRGDKESIHQDRERTLSRQSPPACLNARANLQQR